MKSLIVLLVVFSVSLVSFILYLVSFNCKSWWWFACNFLQCNVLASFLPHSDVGLSSILWAVESKIPRGLVGCVMFVLASRTLDENRCQLDTFIFIFSYIHGWMVTTWLGQCLKQYWQTIKRHTTLTMSVKEGPLSWYGKKPTSKGKCK